MFKSKFKFLIVIMCVAVFILGSTIIFCAQTQNLGGEVSVTYNPSVDFLKYQLNTTGDGWIVTGYDESKRNGNTTLQIPDNHTENGKTLPVTEIADNAFNMSDFEYITIGDNVLTIGNSAFAYSEGIKEIKIGKSLQTISAASFVDCGTIERINIPESVQKIEIGAFALTLFNNFYINVANIDSNMVRGMLDMTGEIGCFHLGKKVETIEDNAFMYLNDKIEMWKIDSKSIYSKLTEKSSCGGMLSNLQVGDIVYVLESASQLPYFISTIFDKYCDEVRLDIDDNGFPIYVDEEGYLHYEFRGW